MDPSSTPSTSEPMSNALVELLRELRLQRLDTVAENNRAAAERKSERFWRRAMQIAFVGAPLMFGLLYFVFFVMATGFRWGPMSEVVGVVRIEGEISSASMASARRVVPLLEKAFESSSVKAVVLSIDSPGGLPVEAEQIANSIDALKKKHKKPVVAVIRNLGASAGYMVALHADEIYAGKYSLVGSIGALIAPWDFHEAMKSVKVSQRVYASGKLKAFLNPYTPVTPEVEAKAQKIVDQLGGEFASELQHFRKSSLKPGTDYTTGEVWSGVEAHQLGLVDGVNTLEQVVATKWGLEIYDFGPRNDGMSFLSSRVETGVLSALESWVRRQALRVN